MDIKSVIRKYGFTVNSLATKHGVGQSRLNQMVNGNPSAKNLEWLASLIGLATPYWLALLWLMVPWGVEPTQWSLSLQSLAEHFGELADIRYALPPYLLERGILLLFALVLAAGGIMHFWSRSFEDKIRIRLLYGFFITLTALTVLFILAQPQHYDVLMRVLAVCASPLIAHVFTFTSSRLSGILFFTAIALSVALTVLSALTTSQI